MVPCAKSQWEVLDLDSVPPPVPLGSKTCSLPQSQRALETQLPFCLIHVLGLLSCSSNVPHSSLGDLNTSFYTSPPTSHHPEGMRNPTEEKLSMEPQGGLLHSAAGQAGAFSWRGDSVTVGHRLPLLERPWLKLLLCQQAPRSLSFPISKQD